MAALVVSGLCGLVVVCGTAVVLAGGRVGPSGRAERDAAGIIIAAGSADTQSVQPGDCIEQTGPDRSIFTLPLVPCTEPHHAEIVGMSTLDEGPYVPTEVHQIAAQRCAKMLEEYSTEIGLDSLYLYPSKDSSNRGRRTVVCIATAQRELVGSIQS